MVEVMDVAKWFLANNSNVAFPSRAGNIKLQKLLYYSKAMYFAVHGESLFDEEFEAWENGPASRNIYREYRHNGLPETFVKSDCPVLEPKIERILKVVNHVYGSMTSNNLIDLTHQELPWKELEDEVEIRANPIIRDEVIRDYYKPLKDIFNLIDDDELENTSFININGNIFSYDTRNTVITAEDREKLSEYGEIERDNSFAVYKNADDELVVYWLNYQEGDIFDKTNIVFKETGKRDLSLHGHPMLIPVNIDFDDNYYYFFTISSRLHYYATEPSRYFPISKGNGTGLIKPSLVDLKHVYKYRKQSHNIRGYLDERSTRELITKFNEYDKKNRDSDFQDFEEFLSATII